MHREEGIMFQTMEIDFVDDLKWVQLECDAPSAESAKKGAMEYTLRYSTSSIWTPWSVATMAVLHMYVPFSVAGRRWRDGVENWAPLPKGFPQYNKSRSVTHVRELQGVMTS